MTEAEWLGATDPIPMLTFLRGKVSDRKLRLFACGCCWRIHQYSVETHEGRQFLLIAEKFADGVANEADLNLYNRILREVAGKDYIYLGWEALHPEAWEAARLAQDDCCQLCLDLRQSSAPFGKIGKRIARFMDRLWTGADTRFAVFELPTPRKERVSQTRLLHDIFGNPFCSITLNPTWLTSTVVALATGIYEEKAFDRLPILADALQDAECDSEEMLNHCRSDGVHVRGCWVIDLVTGRK